MRIPKSNPVAASGLAIIVSLCLAGCAQRLCGPSPMRCPDRCIGEMCEPPLGPDAEYHGYKPTCWREWPADWIGCPTGSMPGEMIVDEGVPSPIPEPAGIPSEVDPAPAPPPAIPPGERSARARFKPQDSARRTGFPPVPAMDHGMGSEPIPAPRLLRTSAETSQSPAFWIAKALYSAPEAPADAIAPSPTIYPETDFPPAPSAQPVTPRQEMPPSQVVVGPSVPCQIQLDSDPPPRPPRITTFRETTR